MHPDRRFCWNDQDAMRAFVANRAFGMLFAQTPDGPRVAHVPVVVDQDRIAFHLSRGNPLAGALDGANALFLVNGPDAYVSPDWYGLDDQVPTWNYVSVELEGRVSALPPEALSPLIDRISDDRERRLSPKPAWTRAKMQDGLFDRMLGAITGYELRIATWRGTRKLGQNKPDAARLRVAEALDGIGSAAMARLMRETAER
jgi:transcriptional regulator